MLNKINCAISLRGMAIAFFFFFITTGVFAQSSAGTRKISGVVVDKTNEPLIGVNIIVRGMSNGTITDMNGKYSISVPEEKPVLIFSYIGYKKQEVKVVGRNVVNVTLEEDVSNLDEVVVVGYGTQRRRDLTGAVASISGEKLKDIPVISAAQAITGKLPGVQVTQTDGSPDAEIKIRVRGGGSITQDNSPLYIVDGFPVDNITDIAPSDIESIDVLKDASTTAIYGARGANGVILVTTRTGHEGKTMVKLNTYYGVRKVTKFLDTLNPSEFVFWQYEALKGEPSSSYGAFGDYDLYREMPNSNWQKKVFGNQGTSLYNNLSVSGGSKLVKYNVSLTRNDDKDIMIDTRYNQTNLTSNTSFKVNDHLSFDLNMRLSDYDLEGGVRGSLTTFIQYRPTKGINDFIDVDAADLEDETDLSLLNDPISQSKGSFRHRKRQNFSYNSAMNITFLKDFTYRFEFGQQYLKNLTEEYYGMNTSSAQQYGNMPLASKDLDDGSNLRLANVLTYKKKNLLGKNNLTAMLGQEITQSSIVSLTTSAKYFPQYASKDDALSMMQLGKADPIISSYPPANKVASFFGRMNYDYDGKYLAAITFRADGSSKFAPGHRWGFFPAASGAWRLSEEKFLKENEKWLSNLKLRVSYGQVGNDRIDNNAWRKTQAIGAKDLFLADEATPTSLLTLTTVLYNNDLKWETTVTRNLGLDFGFFNQRLSGSIELYRNTTKDLLVKMNIPSHTGELSQWRNLGQTSNSGVELSLEASIIQKKDFDLSASFNIAFNKNHIDQLGDTKSWTITSGWSTDADAPKDDYLIEEGGQVGLMYGYITEGYYTMDDFIYNPNYDRTKPETAYTLKPGVANCSSLTTPRYFRPGALKLKDISGPNGEPDGKIDGYDKTVIGNANPLHTGGFNLTARYKNVDFSAFFNWVYGNDIYNATKLNFTSFRGGKSNRNLLALMSSDNRWIDFDQETGTLITDPIQLAEINQNATLWSPGGSTLPLHSWGVEDGSFLRLNNLTIGYSFPKKMLSKVKISQLRFYVTGSNLWLWTKYSGYDPEVDAVRSTPLSPGIDWNSYPRSRTFNFGVNLTF